METNFDEDVSELNRIELQDRKDKIARDRKYVNYKIIYWNKQYNLIKHMEYELTRRSKEISDSCDICGKKPNKDIESCLKKLPDKRLVCKPCWFKECEKIRIDNYNKYFQANGIMILPA